MLIAVQRLLGRVCRKCYRVADFGFGNGFNGCGNVSDFTGGKLVRGLKAWGEHADFRNIEFIACVHEADSVACTHNAVHDAHIAQRTLVIVCKNCQKSMHAAAFRYRPSARENPSRCEQAPVQRSDPFSRKLAEHPRQECR